MTMTRREEYLQYLASPDWKEHRSFALGRTSGFCQFCGAIATQVHHVQYPKRFGKEHPHSLIPVCERCHNISHGVQDMKPLTDATQMTELSPGGGRLKYLLSGGRVYASAKSWARALQLPESIKNWFETGLTRTAMFKKDFAGGDLEMSHLNIAVYRWHAVAELLRAFDREWYRTEYRSRTIPEQKEIKLFHDNYERLVSWGYDLQERAIASALDINAPSNSTVSQEALIEVMKQAVAPRLRIHDEKLHEHDVVISEIREVVPTLRDQDEFISVKQAISEQGYEADSMPLYPKSKENLSCLAGNLLTYRGSETGPSVTSRIDGQSLSVVMNTYRRRDVYAVLKEVIGNKQQGLHF